MSEASSSSSNPRPSAPRARPATSSRVSRRKTAENWDDDFEFTLPRPARPASARAQLSSTGDAFGTSKSGVQSSVPPTNKDNKENGGSPASLASWGNSPPPSPTAASSSSRRQSKTTQLTSLDLTARLPRSSPSETSTLASPDAGSGSLHLASSLSNSGQPLLPTNALAAVTPPDTSRRSSLGTSGRKLVKRHPSAQFVPISRQDEIMLSVASTSPDHSDSHLHHMPSMEQMPPPPPPSTATIKGTRGRNSLIAGKKSISTSPSQDDVKNATAKKSGFWKRLSGAPAPPPEQAGELSSRLRRRRSSSGGPSFVAKDTAQPPVPPLPSNVRSPSSTSTTSFNSTTSLSSPSVSGAVTVSASDPHRDRSSLTRAADAKKSSTPMSMDISSVRPRPSTPPKNHQFSRGFHLPSPAAGSPYNPSTSVFSSTSPPPPLPHSSSFSGHDAPKLDGSDAETEAEKDAATPRRKKIRPVSALPAPKMNQRGWNGDGWKGFGGGSPPIAKDPPASASPKPSGIAASTSHTLRRLGSISKKHGRKLSGGFKFGTNSSTNPVDARMTSGSSERNQHLETVQGSPSKPVDVQHRTEPSTELILDGSPAQSTGAGFVRTSTFPALTSRASIVPSTNGHSKNGSISKERRRQSWNDFVIPTQVLLKQKELRQNIGAVKKFAGGVEKLKRLVDLHTSIRIKLDSENAMAQRRSFDSLESEFVQWWEMATVLIEVGSTGAQVADDAPDSTRMRRVTLASDEAKEAGDLLLHHSPGALASLAESKDGSPRKTSLPDPARDNLVASSLLRPDQWRASTGRQDLSKRQLEVLRSMLQTPVPDVPVNGQKSRTISTTTKADHASDIDSTAAMRRLPASSPGRARHDPSDLSLSSISITSATLPSPGPGNAAQRPVLKSRRSSKAGLAGLKDFLRSLKSPTPSPEKLDPATPTTAVQPSGRFNGSPITPDSQGGYEHLLMPRSESTMSGGFVHVTPPRPTPPLRRVPSPEKGQKRPNIRNIFRTSSGSWSDLVRGGQGVQNEEALPTPSTTPPEGDTDRKSRKTRHAKRQSVDSSHTAESVESATRKAGPDTGGSKKPPKTPTSGIFSFGTPWKSPLSPRRNKGPSPADLEMGEKDLTLKPRRKPRKSHILGLGVPSSPNGSPAGTAYVYDEDEMLRGRGVIVSNPPPSRKINRQSLTEIRSASAPNPIGDTEEGGEGDEDLVVALTPDNLPVLLDYLKQCEIKLKEWKERAEAVMADQDVSVSAA